nr:MAG TPA: hypothetical protein [Caudoviricetes sp.]
MSLISDLNNDVARRLVGAYLRGVAGKDIFPKEISNKEIGINVLGESFDINERPLVNLGEFNSPAESMGVLNQLIESCKRKIDSTYTYAEGVAGPNSDVDKFIKGYANDLVKEASRIAFSEGEADDEMKTSLDVLLREGKEVYIQRQKEIEEEKNKDANDPMADNSLNPEDPNANPDDLSGGDDTSSSDLGDGDLSGDDTSLDDGSNDLGGEELPEGDDTSMDDTNSDDGMEMVDGDELDESTPSGILEGTNEDGTPTEDDDNSAEDTSDDSDDSNEDDKDDDDTKAEGESFKGINKALEEINSKAAYAENKRYFHKGRISQLSYKDLEIMTKRLMNVEAKSIKAIGERMDVFNEANKADATRLHSIIVKSEAATMVMRHRLNINCDFLYKY